MKRQTKTNHAWTTTVILLAFLLFYFPSMLALFDRSGGPGLVPGLLSSTIYTSIFILNYLWLIPGVLMRGNKTLFVLCNLVSVIIGCSLIPMWFQFHGGVPMPRHVAEHIESLGDYMLGYINFVIRDGMTMVLSITLAYALRVSKEQEAMRRHRLEAESERHNIELKSLKAQLNPHFLFNAINNIYTLIGVSSDRAQKALYELSGMLRFLIYDASAYVVPLTKEFSFIRDYIELMKLRLNPSVRLEVEISEEGTDRMAVAPLLFMTLIENAFKHMAANADGKFVSIKIGIEQEWLICRVINSCNPGVSRSLTNSGVGLTNVESQLRLLYPDSAGFHHSEKDGVYTAEIKIVVNALLNDDLCKIKTIET